MAALCGRSPVWVVGVQFADCRQVVALRLGSRRSLCWGRERVLRAYLLRVDRAKPADQPWYLAQAGGTP